VDRGYDAEAIHRQIREELHAASIIPICSWNNELFRKELIVRKWLNSSMTSDAVEDKPVENKCFVLKRKFSGDPKARSFKIQMMEIAGKIIVCTIHRFL
jgi:hypothetical protein